MTRFGDQAPRPPAPATRPRPSATSPAPSRPDPWGPPPAAPATTIQRPPPDRWDASGPPAALDAGPGWAETANDGPAERGWPAWSALLVMVAITTVGVIIDVVRNATGGVNYAIIAGALAAILIVRRTSMFPVVIAPPLVYLLGSAAVLYLRSGGPHNKSVLIDIATNWLVYGFPAMAAATAVVLVVAGIRMLVKR